MGADLRDHDPYVDHWYEFESQDTYPAPGHSWSRFFQRQEELVNLRLHKDLPQAAKDVEAHGRFDISTLKEPYRLEGKKTMGY